MIMKGCLFLLGLIFTTSFAFAEDLTLLTNGFNFNAYPFQDISTIEKTSLNTALSNELYNISNYILATNQFGSLPEINQVLDSKYYHLYLITSIYNKYNIIPPVYPYTQPKRPARTLREYCKIRVLEELGNKSLYEMMTYQVNNKDIQAVFSLIEENSQKSFKLMEIAAMRKK